VAIDSNPEHPKPTPVPKSELPEILDIAPKIRVVSSQTCTLGRRE